MSKTNIILWQRQAASVYIQRNTPYTVGDVALSTKLEDLYLKCTGTGTTGGTEPDWTSSDNDVTDGTATFALISDMLKSYPIGCYYESSVSTNPRQLFGGVWEEDISGRVLISRSSDIEAGTEAGEANHQLSTNEMPKHTPGGTINNVSLIGEFGATYGGRVWFGWDTANGIASRQGSATNCIIPNTAGTYTNTNIIRIDATHAHTFTGNTVGGDAAHNNMQPYRAVYRWHRTA